MPGPDNANPPTRGSRIVLARLAVIALLALGATALPAPAAEAEPRLEAYPLGAANPGHILRALAPLLDAQARLSHLDGSLLVLAPATGHAVVRQFLEKIAAGLPARPGARPAQYLVSVVQGASERQARELTDGQRHEVAGVRAGAGQARITSLRVSAGEPARTGITEAYPVLEAAAGGRRASGIRYRQERLRRGFEVTVTPRGPEVEVVIEPLAGRRDPVRADTRTGRGLRTRVFVPLDRWVAIATDSVLDAGSGAVHSTRAAFDGSHTLLRVTRVPPDGG